MQYSELLDEAAGLDHPCDRMVREGGREGGGGIEEEERERGRGGPVCVCVCVCACVCVLHMHQFPPYLYIHVNVHIASTYVYVCTYIHLAAFTIVELTPSRIFDQLITNCPPKMDST